MKKRLGFIIILLILLAVFLWIYAPSKERIYQYLYDIKNPQELVQSRKQIDVILANFKQISFAKLDKKYRASTSADVAKYQEKLQNSTYYIVQGTDIFRYIVGDFRIKDFLPTDVYYRQNIRQLNSGSPIYWLVDKELLYKLLALQDALHKKGFNETGFVVLSGFRSPAHNEAVGGASQSRHLLGQAIDIYIYDINNDGRSTQEDKSIVLDILEKEIIKDKGGIGKYPGTMNVHFDTRGYRARWDSY